MKFLGKLFRCKLNEIFKTTQLNNKGRYKPFKYFKLSRYIIGFYYV